MGCPYTFELFPQNFIGRRVLILADGYVSTDDDALAMDRVTNGNVPIETLEVTEDKRSADVQAFLNARGAK